jgi:hypothetical protein
MRKFVRVTALAQPIIYNADMRKHTTRIVREDVDKAINEMIGQPFKIEHYGEIGKIHRAWADNNLANKEGTDVENSGLVQRIWTEADINITDSFSEEAAKLALSGQYGHVSIGKSMNVVEINGMKFNVGDRVTELSMVKEPSFEGTAIFSAITVNASAAIPVMRNETETLFSLRQEEDKSWTLGKYIVEDQKTNTPSQTTNLPESSISANMTTANPSVEEQLAQMKIALEEEKRSRLAEATAREAIEKSNAALTRDRDARNAYTNMRPVIDANAVQVEQFAEKVTDTAMRTELRQIAAGWKSTESKPEILLDEAQKSALVTSMNLVTKIVNASAKIPVSDPSAVRAMDLEKELNESKIKYDEALKAQAKAESELKIKQDEMAVMLSKAATGVPQGTAKKEEVPEEVEYMEVFPDLLGQFLLENANKVGATLHPSVEVQASKRFIPKSVVAELASHVGVGDQLILAIDDWCQSNPMLKHPKKQ